MLLVKQSTAITDKWGPFVDATDGVTPETALTIQKANVRLSKAGGNMAAASADQGAADAGAPHDESGVYDGSLDATDTATLGRLRVDIQVSGAAPYFKEYMVLPANIYDSLIAGTDYQEVDILKFLGNDPSAAGIAEQAIADATHAGTTILAGVVDAAATTTVLPIKSIEVTPTASNQWQDQTLCFAKDTATAALRGVKRKIQSHTTSAITLSAALGTAPAEDDEFIIY